MNRPDDSPKNSILIYTTEDGLTKIDTTFDGDTVWLSIDQMAELFQRDKSTISRHIKNIFAEGELERDSVVANLQQLPQTERPIRSNSTILTSLFLLVIVSNPNEAHSSVSGNWHPEGIYAQGICAG